MKKVFSAMLLTLLLSNCAPIAPKIELPHNSGNPPIITYSRVIKTSGDKKINYNNALKRFMGLHEQNKIVDDDPGNCYFLVKGYTMYKYKKEDETLRYLITFQGTEVDCTITLSKFRILGGPMDNYYSRNGRVASKRLNPSYVDINTKVNALLDDLASQLK